MLLSGCSGSRPRSAPDVVYGPLDSFSVFYRPLSEVREQWSRRGNSGASNVICFFDWVKSEMWLAWGKVEDCIFHELKHREGRRHGEAMEKELGFLY